MNNLSWGDRLYYIYCAFLLATIAWTFTSYVVLPCFLTDAGSLNTLFSLCFHAVGFSKPFSSSKVWTNASQLDQVLSKSCSPNGATSFLRFYITDFMLTLLDGLIFTHQSALHRRKQKTITEDGQGNSGEERIPCMKNSVVKVLRQKEVGSSERLRAGPRG